MTRIGPIGADPPNAPLGWFSGDPLGLPSRSELIEAIGNAIKVILFPGNAG